MNEFEKFAKGHLGISSLALDRYKKVNAVYGVPQALATVPTGAYKDNLCAADFFILN